MSDIRLDIPDITVIIDKGDEYKVIVNNPHTVVKNVTGSLLRYADIAGQAYTASLAYTSSLANYALTASYVPGAASDWNTLANKPDGLVSNSVQVQLDQISGAIFSASSFTFPQDLNVNGTLYADKLLVSSSVIYNSGSTKFGDTLDDTHQFTGSVSMVGGQQFYGGTEIHAGNLTVTSGNSLIVNGAIFAQNEIVAGFVSASIVEAESITGSFQGDGSQLTGIVTTLGITGSTGQDTIDLKTEGLLVTGSNGIITTVTNNTVTVEAPPGTVTASAQINVFDTTGGNNVATLGANSFYGDQKVYGDLEVHTGNLVVTSGNTLLVSGAIFAQNEIVAGFVSASELDATSITGSFKGDGSQLTGLVTDLRVSGSIGSDTISLLTDDLTIVGQNGIETTITNNTITIDVPNALTASLYGTASVADGIDIVFAGEYETGSDIPLVLQIGGTGNIISASYALTASYANNAILPPGVLSSSTQVIYTDIPNIPVGMISTSAQFNALSNTSASYALTASYVTNIPTIDTSSFATTGSNIFIGNQIITGSLTVSGSSTFTNIGPTVLSGSVNTTNGITGSLFGTSSWTSNAITASYAPIPNGVVSSSSQVVNALPIGTVSSSAQYPGWVTASSQIDYNNIQNKLSGVYSSSTQVVTAINGQTISPLNVNATGTISGTSATLSGDVNILGTLTVASQSIQYVTSSQFNVSTNKIIVNTNNSLQFGGISVIDSGSTTNSGSLYWDSLNNHWVYENISGAPYNSAILIAGPENLGTLGQERGLITGRIPTATGDDHIDTAPQSSSIRVDFISGRTDIEHGLFVTGSLTANGTVTLAGIPSSSAQITTLLPNGIISSSTQLPSGVVSASSQIDYNSIQNKLSGVVSSSTQIQPLLPGGTVSSSAQYPGWVTASSQVDFTQTKNNANIISSSTQFKTLTDPFTGSFTGSHTGTFPYSGLTGTPTLVSASSQIDYNSIQNKLSGVVSSSAQVAPLLPGGTVSSSAQYPGWITSSTQVVWSSVNYNSGIVSSSAQVAPLLPGGTVSSSTQLASSFSSTGSNTFTGVETFTSLSIFAPVQETMSLKPAVSTGTTSFDFTTGSIFYLTGLTGNGTWNVINVPTTSQMATTFTFVLIQGATPYSASAYQINSAGVTVNWLNGVAPVGTSGSNDVIGLTAFRSASSWTVLGTLSSFK